MINPFEQHTVYRFEPNPVSEAQLKELYDLVKMGPTSQNSQPLRITFVSSDEARARLLPHVTEGNRPKVQSAPVTAILAYDVDFHEELPRTNPINPTSKDSFADETGRHGFASLNSSIQIGYFILAARMMGLGVGPMGGFDKRGVDEEFFPDGRHRSLVLANLGYQHPEGTFPRQPRLPFEDACELL